MTDIKDDDELLRGLAAAAKRDRARPRLASASWEKLARGTITEDEKRALEEEAAHDVEAREGLIALAPLDAEAEARVVARVDAARGAVVLPFRGRVAILVGAVAIAAGVAFAVFRPTSDAPLPQYAMLVSGDVRSARGAARVNGAPYAVDAHSHVVIDLRPHENVTGPVVVRLALVRAGRAEAWSGPEVIAPSGAVRLEGDGAALFGGVLGSVELVVGVGRASAVPRDPAALAASQSGGGVQVFRARFEVR